MKKAIALLAAAGSLFALVAVAGDTKAGKNAVLVPAGDLKWADVPKVPEAKTAVVEGDSAKGPHHSFTRFNAGFATPLHHHTADHYVTTISGTMVITVDGVETKLPPGSYIQFTKKQLHTARCESGADCVFFTDARGKWDMVAREEKRTEAGQTDPGATGGKK